MVKLLIFDLYGTLLKADKRDGEVRDGLLILLDHYASSKKAIFTDGRPDIVEPDLKLSGLKEKFDAIYDARHCISELYFKIESEDLRKRMTKYRGGNIKNLEVACNDLSIPKSDSVFVGDNFYDRDSKSAKLSDVRFIQVPQFRANPPHWSEKERNEGIIQYEDSSNPFSFEMLIGKI